MNKETIGSTETDALAKAWRDWDDSETAEQPKSFRELSWELEQQRDKARELALELRDKLRALAEECLLPEFNQEWDTFVEAESALTKAKEVLP
jgi:hypothetical protein